MRPFIDPRLARLGVALLSTTLAAGLGPTTSGCAGADSTMKVKTSERTASTVARYRTYTKENAQEAPQGFEPSPLGEQARGKIHRLVDDEMTKHGYVPADNGEMIVRVATGRRTVPKEPVGRAAAAGAPAPPETEAELVIDMFERGSNEQVFHGFAKDTVDTDKLDDAKLAEAVSRILSPVPISTAGTPSM